jgi:hypothetical protein
MTEAAEAPEAPEGRGASVTQHGPVSAGEHYGGPPSPGREPDVADGVDAAMDPVQPPTANPELDSPAPQPRFTQLAPGDDSMLRRCERGDRTVDRRLGALFIHVMDKSPKPTR